MSQNGPLYRVSVSGAMSQQIKELAKIASSRGIRAEFMSSLAAIHQKLRDNPLGFGEHRFRTKEPIFLCRIGAIQPVAIQFAIHEKLRIVFILKVFLMGTES